MEAGVAAGQLGVERFVAAGLVAPVDAEAEVVDVERQGGRLVEDAQDRHDVTVARRRSWPTSAARVFQSRAPSWRATSSRASPCPTVTPRSASAPRRMRAMDLGSGGGVVVMMRFFPADGGPGACVAESGSAQVVEGASLTRGTLWMRGHSPSPSGVQAAGCPGHWPC